MSSEGTDLALQHAALRVLVVDDDDIRRFLLETWLRLLKVSATGVENGGKAWEMLREGGFHLVVSDLNMPVMDGGELLRRIRQHPDLAALPFIAITSSAEEDLDQKLLQEGADAFIRFPVEREEFIGQVHRFIA